MSDPAIRNLTVKALFPTGRNDMAGLSLSIRCEEAQPAADPLADPVWVKRLYTDFRSVPTHITAALVADAERLVPPVLLALAPGNPEQALGIYREALFGGYIAA